MSSFLAELRNLKIALFPLLILWVITVYSAHAQQSLSGVVVDKKTQSPLMGVNVIIKVQPRDGY